MRSGGMRIRLARKVGFCFGVKRAIEMAEDVLEKETGAYSLGSIIHNKHVVEGLAKKGLKVIDDINKAKGCIVISSHGIGPSKAEEIRKRSLRLIDTTCPFVRVAQGIAQRLNREGYKVVIVGDADHPEVKALVEFAGKHACVVKDVKGLKGLKIKKSDKVGVLSQTTQAMDDFIAVVRALVAMNLAQLRVFNTICADAEDRQRAARDLAREVGVMLIVGGRNSANTRRLFQVCRKTLRSSYLIETSANIDNKWFERSGPVGITSGASTPDGTVKEVVDAVRKITKFKVRRSTASITW
jgi:4-hydroxy-3-methylbut-2-enyl diphosphate reductase